MNLDTPTLDLTSKMLGEEASVELSNALAKNTTITCLDLTNARLNQVTSRHIAHVMKVNTTITDLSLMRNEIDPQALGEALRINTTLKKLNLRSCGLETTKGTEHLFESLCYNTSLVTLNLSHNSLSILIDRLLEALKENKTLQVLYLGGNHFDSVALRGLADVLQKNQSITEINMDLNNSSEPEALHAIAKALESPNVKLKKLSLISNALRDDGIKAFATCLERNTSLTSLDVSLNHLTQDSMTMLAKALAKNKTLKILKAGHNYLGKEGPSVLADYLAQNETLETLDLTNTQMDVAGCTKILEKVSRLKELLVGNNNMSDMDVAFGEALKRHTNISYLVMNHCNLGPKGSHIIAESLGKNTSLIRLNLSGSGVTDDSAFVMSQMLLSSNTTLKVLSLSENQLSDHVAKSLAKMLTFNTTLKELYVKANSFEVDGVRCISQALMSNTSLNVLDMPDQALTLGREFGDILEKNGSIRKCHIYGSDEMDRINQICERNKAMHTLAKETSLALIAARRFGREFSWKLAPKEMIQMIAMYLWRTRSDLAWSKKK